MSKRYIAALNPSSAESDKVFKDFLNSQGWGWWHWIQNFWIIDVTDETYTSGKISNDITRIFPKVHHLVIELPKNVVWYGVGPYTIERNMFKWLSENMAPDLKEKIPPPTKHFPVALELPPKE